MALLENGVAKESHNERVFSTVYFTEKKEFWKGDEAIPNPWYSERVIDDPVNPGHKKQVPVKVFVANTEEGYVKVLGFRPRNAWTFGYLKESYEPGDTRKAAKGGDSLVFPPVLQHIAARDGVPFGPSVMSTGDVDFFTWNVRKELKETVIPQNLPMDIQRTMQAFLYEGANTVFRSGIGYFLTGIAFVETAEGVRKVIPALYRFDSMSSVDWVRQELFPALEAMDGEGFLYPYVVVRQLAKGNPATFAGLMLKDDKGQPAMPKMPKGVEAETAQVYASLADKESSWQSGFAAISAGRKQRVSAIYNGQHSSIEVYNIGKGAKYQIPLALFEPRGAAVGEVLSLREADGTAEAITDSRKAVAAPVVRNDPRKQPAPHMAGLRENAKVVEGDEWEGSVDYDPSGEYVNSESVDF